MVSLLFHFFLLHFLDNLFRKALSFGGSSGCNFFRCFCCSNFSKLCHTLSVRFLGNFFEFLCRVDWRFDRFLDWLVHLFHSLSNASRLNRAVLVLELSKLLLSCADFGLKLASDLRKSLEFRSINFSAGLSKLILHVLQGLRPNDLETGSLDLSAL